MNTYKEILSRNLFCKGEKSNAECQIIVLVKSIARSLRLKLQHIQGVGPKNRQGITEEVGGFRVL